MQTPQNINNYGFINFDIRIFYPYQQHELFRQTSSEWYTQYTSHQKQMCPN